MIRGTLSSCYLATCAACQAEYLTCPERPTDILFMDRGFVEDQLLRSSGGWRQREKLWLCPTCGEAYDQADATVREAVHTAAEVFAGASLLYTPQDALEPASAPLAAQSITFSLITPRKGPAVAELSRMSNARVLAVVRKHALGAKVDEHALQEPWYYFHRLLVPSQERGQGWGSQLMAAVSRWADFSRLHIYNEVHPYGDEPYEKGLAMLTRFYERWGFVSVARALMIRLYTSDASSEF